MMVSSTVLQAAGMNSFESRQPRRLTALTASIALMAGVSGCSTSGTSPATSPAPEPSASVVPSPSPTATASIRAPATSATAVHSVAPVPVESNPPGDIPDNLAFVSYTNKSGGYAFTHPEGWAQTGSGSRVRFTDKLNGVTVDSLRAAQPPTVASARSTDVPRLQGLGPSFPAPPRLRRHRPGRPRRPHRLQAQLEPGRGHGQGHSRRGGGVPRVQLRTAGPDGSLRPRRRGQRRRLPDYVSEPEDPMTSTTSVRTSSTPDGLHRFFRRGGEEVAALRDVSITLAPGRARRRRRPLWLRQVHSAEPARRARRPRRRIRVRRRTTAQPREPAQSGAAARRAHRSPHPDQRSGGAPRRAGQPPARRVLPDHDPIDRRARRSARRPCSSPTVPTHVRPRCPEERRPGPTSPSRSPAARGCCWPTNRPPR